MLFPNFFFTGAILACQGTGCWSADPIQSRSNPDPDPKHWPWGYSPLSNCDNQCCGSGASLTSGSGIRIRVVHPGSYFRELRKMFLVKILKIFDADPGWKKIGSGINIPDPQHWRQGLHLPKNTKKMRRKAEKSKCTGPLWRWTRRRGRGRRRRAWTSAPRSAAPHSGPAQPFPSHPFLFDNENLFWNTRAGVQQRGATYWFDSPQKPVLW